LRWVRADGRAGELRVLDLARKEDHAGVEGEELFGGGEDGIDIDFAEAGLLDDELAETDEKSFKGGKVDGFAAADSAKGFEDFGLLHEASGKSGIQRRKCESAVAIDLDELAAGAKENDRAELGVDGAAENELVAFGANHGLHGHAE
jgi:hypothetical protein